MKYDYLIVGAGLFGSVCARELTDIGKKCLVVEKRNHIAGNIYTEKIEGIDVHVYGGHIFHTSNTEIWNYVNRFAEFNNYVNSPIANYKGELYNMPFNMNTFHQMWGVKTPSEAKKIIEIQRKEIKSEPQNLEEQAISLVGRDIYEKLVKGYTEKQWGHQCTELPAFIIKRLPVRYTFDNNYFNDRFQGIPIDGYTRMIEKMLDGIEVILNTDYHREKNKFQKITDKVIYTGAVDEYFDYCYGPLEWRSLKFETKVMEESNYQGVAAVNYTDRDTLYTRVLEHKHFNFGNQPKTVITYEYPSQWSIGDEPYYPVNNEKNMELYLKYEKLAVKEKKVYFGGRLGAYRYYDMDKDIMAAFELLKELKNEY
ncbi:MAG: UDP-galactopyranose mutase [Clostridiales bacterium]|nr:UDP-galactopyranose mutase [Clostridiales bacterium]